MNAVQARGALQTIAGNTAWLMGDRILRMVVGITVGAWIARHLGPERYGALAYVLALVSLFQTAASLGLDLVLARELAKRTTHAHLLLGSSLWMRLVAAAVAWIVVCLTVVLLRPGDSEAWLLTAIVAAALLLQPADLVDLWFQSQSQNRRAVIPRVVSFFCVSVLRIVLILEDAPLWMFAVSYIVDAAMAAVFIGTSYRTFPTAQQWQWQGTTARALLRSAWPFLVSGLSIIVYMRVDQILLRSMASERELGLYSAILPFSQAWSFIPATLCASAMPYLVRLHSESPEEFRKRFAKLFALLFWSALVISVLVAMGANTLVNALLGTRYAGAGTILSVHVFTNLPVFLGVAQVAYLNIVGRTRLILFQTLAGLATSVALNIILIPLLGALGSAIAGLVAFSVSAIVCNAFLARELFKMQILSWARIHVR